jgi:hypothetical protein
MAKHGIQYAALNSHLGSLGVAGNQPDMVAFFAKSALFMPRYGQIPATPRQPPFSNVVSLKTDILRFNCGIAK